MIILSFKKNLFFKYSLFSFLLFDVFKLNMPTLCNNNDTICKTPSSDNTTNTDTIVGFTIGSIACLIFIILITIFIYLLCCKARYRSRFQSQSRSHPPVHNQEQSMNIDHNQQQPQLNPRRSVSDEPPPSYQEASRDNNINFNKNT